MARYAAEQVYFETKYAEKPVFGPLPDPNYLKDKLGVTPRGFPYKRIDLDAALETLLVNRLSLHQLKGHIATFEIKKYQYITLFKEGKEDTVVVVSWVLDENNKADRVKIAQATSEKPRYLGHVAFDSELSEDPVRPNVSFKTVGGADYYELSIQVTSPSHVSGALYHIYDWTRQEGYYLGTLVYSVTAAGWFYVNYGTEAWVDRDCSYSSCPVWSQISFNSRIVANHGPSATIRADGVARGYFIPFWVYMHLWASISVNYNLQSFHDGGGWSWTEIIP